MIMTTLVLGMTVDGKIAASDARAPRKPDPADQAHLEYQTSLADLILIGAGTIRAEGSAYTVRDPELLAARAVRGQSPQPITCVVSNSLDLDPSLPFFTQPIERWIFTTSKAIERSREPQPDGTELIAVGEEHLDWHRAYQIFEARAIRKVAALGGGNLTAALFKAGRIDEMWLTVWPVIFGGKDALSPVEGPGFLPMDGPRLHLMETRQLESELFLHYRVLDKPSDPGAVQPT